MSTETRTNYIVQHDFDHTGGVEDLSYPPKFETEDAAYEWLDLCSSRRSNDAWRLSWFLAQFAPASNEYGEARLKRACTRLAINPATGGKWRWMGETWSLDAVRQFDRLRHSHYVPATKVMAEAQLRKDHDKIIRIIDILHRANEGEEDEDGIYEARSVAWVKATIRHEVEGIPPKDDSDGDTPTQICGHLTHEYMQDEERNWYYVTAIIHPNQATWDDVRERLAERGMLGQYVSAVETMEAGE